MEMFELRYFVGVAQHENIHRASEQLHSSPAALSKAITRLEGELGTKLFGREGRNIRLTEQGRLLQRRATELLALEESARLEVGGHRGVIRIHLAGPEILLSKMGVETCVMLKKKLPLSVFEFHATDEARALEQVERGEAQLALVTCDVPPKNGLVARPVGEAKFHTYVGAGHPLYAQATARKIVRVEEVLKHAFVSPSNPLLGKVGLRQSLDGWRDDRFPRKVEYLASSLKIIEELVVSGRAVGYLPDYFGARLAVELLKISGCPYTCLQKVKLVARNPKDVGWLSRLF